MSICPIEMNSMSDLPLHALANDSLIEFPPHFGR